MDAIGTTLSLSRDTNGRIVVNARNAEGAQFGSAGTIVGTGSFSMGITDKNETAFEYTHIGANNSDAFIMGNGENYCINGTGAVVYANDSNISRTIQVNASGSYLDISSTKQGQLVRMDDTATQNITILGKGNDEYQDYGQFNYVSATGGNNRFFTVGSFGSVLKGGSGSDQFYLNGSYDIIDGGAGDDIFVTGQKAYRNVIFGGAGNDFAQDNGWYNYFVGEDGNDHFDANGTNGIASLGDNEPGSAILGENAKNTFVFTAPDITDQNGNVLYTRDNVLNKNRWSLLKFLYVDSTVTEADKRCVGTHSITDDEIDVKLLKYLYNDLEELQ